MSTDGNRDDSLHNQLPSDLDEVLAIAYGEDPESFISPSVLDRIGEVTGSKPKVLLRDDQAGDTPMLKPLGPDDAREAGKYVVHGELGRGGVGAVHRGHDQDLGRDVAMKFLHDKYKGDPAILQRFVEEAQIGGQLQHPGIVPVYDLGMVKGKPFFAMKLVKGQTLAKKLGNRESPASDRRTFLAIFEDVCQTLAYAHARGVVHRDLKPANIMIGSFGEVQVVDWGMGKVLPQGANDGRPAEEKRAAERQSVQSVIETVRSSGHGSQSIVGSVMGTPAYMPPEQARGDVEQMDERSDVFALGAILCEILTGKPPYVGEPDEQIEMAAMARLDDAYARLEECDAEPEMAELATRCLMPAPAARPNSAEVVAKVVHDHLADVESRVHAARVEAAEARVHAVSLKRMQKLGISLTAVIAAGLFVSLWFWRAADAAAENEKIAKLAAVASAQEAQQNEQRAVEQTELAERELARAVEIKRLITEMLQSVDPVLAKDADITMLKGILDTTSKRLTEGAIEDERVAAELHGLVGRVYQSIGLYREAELHLPVAVELQKRVLGEEHPDTLFSKARLPSLYHAQGRYTEAVTLQLQTLQIQKRVLGEEHPYTLYSMSNLAIIYRYLGRYAEAETLGQKTLEIQKRVLGEGHPETLNSMSNLAYLYLAQGREAEAATLGQKTLEVKRRVLGKEHPNSLMSMGLLATLYHRLGRYAEAETLMLETVEIQKRVLGEEHPDTLLMMAKLAALHLEQGRYEEAEPLLLQTLEIRKRVLGEEHPVTLGNRGNLANQYWRQGRYAEAETLFLETLEIQKRVLGEEHPEMLAGMHGLASVYTNQGRLDEAETLFLEIVAIKKRVLGEEHQDTLASMGNLANVYLVQGRHDDAEPLLLETLEIQERVLGAEHPSTLGAITNLGVLYNSMELFEDAASLFEESLPIKRRVLGLQHAWTWYAMTGLVEAYTETDRLDEARPLQRERVELLVAAANKPTATSSALTLAATALLLEDFEESLDPEQALAFARRACALADANGSGAGWSELNTLAMAQHRTGDHTAAVETQRRALARMPEGVDPRQLEKQTEKLADYEAAAENE